MFFGCTSSFLRLDRKELSYRPGIAVSYSIVLVVSAHRRSSLLLCFMMFVAVQKKLTSREGYV